MGTPDTDVGIAWWKSRDCLISAPLLKLVQKSMNSRRGAVPIQPELQNLYLLSHNAGTAHLLTLSALDINSSISEGIFPHFLPSVSALLPTCSPTRDGSLEVVGVGRMVNLTREVSGTEAQEGRPALLLHWWRLLMRLPQCRAHSAAASSFNQASWKALISLFKYTPVEYSHIYDLMTLIIH